MPADLFVDHLPGAVPLFVVPILKGVVPGTESPSVGSRGGHVAVQPQEGGPEHSVLPVARTKLIHHAVRVVLPWTLLEPRTVTLGS